MLRDYNCAWCSAMIWTILRAMFADPEVVKYVGDGKSASREDAEKAIESMTARWEKDGFGRWLAADKATRQFPGKAKLGQRPRNRTSWRRCGSVLRIVVSSASSRSPSLRTSPRFTSWKSWTWCKSTRGIKISTLCNIAFTATSSNGMTRSSTCCFLTK